MKWNVLIRDEDGGHRWVQVSAKTEQKAKDKADEELGVDEFPVAAVPVAGR